MNDLGEFVEAIASMHHETVAAWHARAIDNPYQGLIGLACGQHSFNFRLWHEEDKARCPNAPDAEIAHVKRAIDALNQSRNDGIEQLDDAIAGHLVERDIQPADDARLATETPGSAIDRLSILALRMYHLDEQLRRDDLSDAERDSVTHKLAVARAQHADLTLSTIELFDDIYAGRKRHKTYRQMKMYNDPALNPYLYQAGVRKAG